MPDIIDLNAERARRDGPDDDFVTTIDGVQWYAYSASYPDGANVYSITFWARSFADAHRVVDVIRDRLTLDGQIYTNLPE